MRRLFLFLLIGASVTFAFAADAATGRIIKVLPHFLDLQGRHTLYPSLYERDAYQAMLRQHPEKRSGMRFDVEWKTKDAVWEPLTLRVELRGVAEANLPKELKLEKAVDPTGWLGRWTSFPLTGEQYKSIGEVTAWRVTLLEGTQVLGEQQSFLW